MPSYEFNSLTREFDITGTSAGLSTPVSIANGGTGASGAQTAINNLTQSASASEGHVLSVSSGAAQFQLPRIPEYSTDPATPSAGEMWVLRADTGGTAGNAVGLLAALTQTIGATTGYTLKYKTSSGAVATVALT